MKIDYIKNKLNAGGTGFSILEVIIAVAVFTVSMATIALFMINILDTADKSQSLNQGILVAFEGIEAVKSIRDNDYDDLLNTNDGAHGLLLSTTTWSFNGTTSDIVSFSPDDDSYTKNFTREIIIEELTPGATATTSIKMIESRVTWPQRNGTSSTSLYTRLTNWYR